MWLGVPQSSRRKHRHPGASIVIPAQAGNQTLRAMPIPLGSGFRRNDGFFVHSKNEYALIQKLLFLEPLRNILLGYETNVPTR